MLFSCEFLKPLCAPRSRCWEGARCVVVRLIRLLLPFVARGCSSAPRPEFERSLREIGTGHGDVPRLHPHSTVVDIEPQLSDLAGNYLGLIKKFFIDTAMRSALSGIVVWTLYKMGPLVHITRLWMLSWLPIVTKLMITRPA